MAGTVLERTTEPLTIFGGQVDPSNPRAFAIRYRIGEHRRLLTGTLTDDDHVVFRETND
jgi:hypothetical protein